MIKKRNFVLLPLILGLFVFADCSKSSSNSGGNGGGTGGGGGVPPATNDVDMWLTKADQSVLLQKQTQVLSFGTTANSYASIDVDSAVAYQTVDGFGYTNKYWRKLFKN